MRWIRHHLLTGYAVLAFAYLLLPIAVVMLFSFNAPSGRFNYVWEGFTLDNWWNWDAVPGIRDALVTSLQVGVISTIVATALGTMVALALVRHRFRGRGTTNLLVFLPMSTPEIVLGASLLTLFLQSRVVTGFLTIFIAHVMFVISYIVVTVKARLIGFDRHLEEAAADLGAPPWRAFLEITLPLMAPAVIAGVLLAFTFSFDDVIISLFVQRPGTSTLPVYILSSFKPGLKGDVAAIVVITLAVSLIGILSAATVLMRGRNHGGALGGLLD